MSQHEFLTVQDFGQIRQNLRRAYETQREVLETKARWQAYAENLERLARDNVRLVVEVDELRRCIDALETKLKQAKARS